MDISNLSLDVCVKTYATKEGFLLLLNDYTTIQFDHFKIQGWCKYVKSGIFMMGEKYGFNGKLVICRGHIGVPKHFLDDTFKQKFTKNSILSRFQVQCQMFIYVYLELISEIKLNMDCGHLI